MLKDLKDFTAKLHHWWTPSVPNLEKAESAPAYHEQGKAELQAGNWQEAITACQQAIKLDPNCMWFYYTLGQAYREQRQWQQVISAFQQAIQRDSSVSWPYYELGRCWLKQGNWQEAIAALQQSIALNPDFAWAYHHLGEIWLDQDQPEAAIAAYEQARHLIPDQLLFQQKLSFARHIQAHLPMTLEMLLLHPPKLHQVFDGLASLGVSEALLHFLNAQVSASSETLETGAGISTLLFALKGAKHHCIVPDAALIDRIQAYCQRHQISLKRVTFYIGRSETVLPQLSSSIHSPKLDLVLIDGRHAFPSPFIDWYYSSLLLNVGGITIIDDTQLWTGDVLKNFLQLEPEWEFVDELPHESPNSAIFRQLQAGSQDKWWLQQPYAVQQRPGSVERVVG
jgi:tetratricopeptide (TPR) repeat protein